MFVLLDGGTEPLLAMLCEVLVRQEGRCERNVWLGWCKIAEKEGFVDDVECPAAAWFFQIGGHAPDGVDILSLCDGHCAAVWLLQRRLPCVW